MTLSSNEYSAFQLVVVPSPQLGKLVYIRKTLFHKTFGGGAAGRKFELAKRASARRPVGRPIGGVSEATRREISKKMVGPEGFRKAEKISLNNNCL